MVREKDLKRDSRNNFQGVQSNPMTRKLPRFLLATVFVISVTALAQTASADPGLPAAPSAAGSTPDTTAASTSNRIGTINIEQAIFASNEGQRDFEALSKKLEPKQTELKGMNDEVESLKKQLTNDKLNEDSRATLVKQVEDKQKKLERSVQDARDDAQASRATACVRGPARSPSRTWRDPAARRGLRGLPDRPACSGRRIARSPSADHPGP